MLRAGGDQPLLASWKLDALEVLLDALLRFGCHAFSPLIGRYVLKPCYQGSL